MNSIRKRLRLCPAKALHARSSPGAVAPQTGSDGAALPQKRPLQAGEEEEEAYLLVEEDTTDSSLIITMEDHQKEGKALKKKATKKKKRTVNEKEGEEKGRTSETDEELETGVEVEIDRELDQALETKSKQHNLTTVNVKNIIHEVITNEHVVAMMKAAINETEAVPPFEPTMTRSKFKEVVEKGVVIPTWNISPIKKSSDANKAPQFVDISLEEEDSSGEEYRPDEDEDDETAEDTFQESDIESTASSPRGTRLNRADDDSCSPWQTSRVRSRRLKEGLMGPPPPPKAPPPKGVTDNTFLDKLHAVEEELAGCMEPYQPMSEDESGVMACRTRSKRTLRDVPLGQLEAELRAPDITPDMYDSSSAPEDREWTHWLRGLMSSDVDNEEECDDEDDPEYNFLAEIDEPDLEDYRDDKAVRITKKEVNELMEELFETLKEDLAGQEVNDEGQDEDEELQEETPAFRAQELEKQTVGAADDEADDDEPVAELRTVRQQLALIRRRRQANPLFSSTQCPEPYTLRLNAQQKQRLQQQLQQHIQLLTQVNLLTSPVPKLHSEAETSRQFLFELDMLAQRGELIRSADHPTFRSAFRASNLQGALALLEELRQAPIDYQPENHKPDGRGHMRCYPVMPAELAWLFATRPVFLYLELLPCANLDPAMYCPRRTAAFTAAEDCLLVLGLRNMEGARDPPKLVSQFLLRKTVVQVRRRILQCCRPGSPDNIVKAFRYQQVLWSMPMACGYFDRAEMRPPVAREEKNMPLWLVRSLPVISPIIKLFNGSPDSPAAPTPNRRGKVRHTHLALLRSSASCSFPSGTRYPPRLPQNLDFRRIGFVLLQQPAASPPTVSEGPGDGSAHSHPSHVLLKHLLLSKKEQNTDIIITSTISLAATEQIKYHCRTLAGLRKRRRRSKRLTGFPQAAGKPGVNEGGMRSRNGFSASREGPASYMETGNDNDDVAAEEEWEEESDVLLVLSESSPSAAGSDADPAEGESGTERKASAVASKASEDCEDEGLASATRPQEKLSSEETEDEEDQTESEDVVFAQDYLRRVCEAVQVRPGLSEQLLQVLDEFSASGPLGAPEVLYSRLGRLLQPWPQLLKDFAAFLSPRQACRCGLLLEQQLFERSRRFLRRMGRSLGENSVLYQQVVSVLQGSSAPSTEDVDKVSSLLRKHPDLQGEVQEIFQQLHSCSHTASVDPASQTPCNGSGGPIDATMERDEDEQGEQQAVCAKNITVTSNGEKVIVWTREADRAILTACQQRGANTKTFRQVSAQLGNKTVQQVGLRFEDLMKLFLSASQKSTSSDGEARSRAETAPD